MKNLFYSLLTIGALAGLASCASNEPSPWNGDGNVTITVELPSFGTRYYGDNLNCNELIYTIYNMEGKMLATDSVKSAFGAGVTSQTVNMQLVPGQSYMIAFYAHNSTSKFSSYKEGVISVDYDQLSANNEDNDAFYCYQQIDATPGTPQKATLERAFAQINFGTNDLTNPTVVDVIAGYTTNLSISKGLYTEMNIVPATSGVTGAPVVSEPYTGTLSIDGTVTANSDFPVAEGNYGNLTSVYVLVGPDAKQVLDEGTYLIKNGETEVRSIPLANIPVRMNYRTNIYGSLLTTTLPVTVDLKPSFNGPDFPYEVVDVWDGEEVETPVKNDEGIYEINSAAQLAGFAEMLNSSNGLKGETFELNATVDMGGNLFEGFGNKNRSFDGIFDGQGHTLRNFKTNSEDEYQSDYGTGVFPRNNGTIKDLTIENVTIGSTHNNQVYGNVTGAVVGYNTGTLENVTVRNCTIYGYGKVAALVGMDENEVPDKAPRYINCVIENNKIYGTHNVAGVVGLSHIDLDMSTCTVNNNTLSPDPFSSITWVKIGPIIAKDLKQNQRPDILIEGQYADYGSVYYATGAKYYNRYDDLNGNGYFIEIDGKQIELDGYPVNTLQSSY